MIHLLRHGRTEANASGRLQGRVDFPLDELGRRQAEAAVLAIGPVDEVVCSPLLRARQTAETFDCEVRVDERFVEIDYGDFDGMPMNELPAGTWDEWLTNIDFRPPGGETLIEVGARVRPALDELISRAEGETIVIVSHVSPIKSAVAWALGVGEEIGWRTHLAVGSISTVAARRTGPVLTSFNATDHLAALS